LGKRRSNCRKRGEDRTVSYRDHRILCPYNGYYLARKKAAIDFFVKAATDKEMIQLQIDTRAAFRALESAASFDAFIQTPEYQRIISTLCILEMMAVGIKTKVFDEEVCYSN
jgi:hypothetical protein